MKSITGRIQEILTGRGKTLATAESCTSGRIAAEITKVPGASAYFQGGLVAYQNRLKEQFLGVDADTMEKCDVVSREVAEKMVKGACRMFAADYAIASTGYAGEGNERVPSGTIWIAWGSVSDVRSRCLRVNTERETNTQNAVNEALRAFLEYLSED